ncbi:MAG: FG-GAP-like repeat-containing protein [Bacteroidota bacterium]
MAKRNPLQPSTRVTNRPRLTQIIWFGVISGLIVLAALFMRPVETQSTQSFSNVAISGTGNAGTALAVSGSKDGGFAWGDINNDGFLDLAVNTASSSNGTRILIANPTDPDNPFFEDKTSDYCNHCATLYKERCAILADINHDGYVDLIRNNHYGSNSSVLIYLNQGPANNYALGSGTGGSNAPNKTFYKADFHDNKMNTEGVFLADFDNDGWLDIVVENHNFGIDILQNPKDGSANFVCLDPTSIGLPASATDGDYGTCVDFDDDGDVDIIARKRNENDFFVNGGDGTFTDGQNVDDANNSNKGGVAFGDFDNDGDYDLYWTDNGTNQIWLNDGTNTLVATAIGGNDGEPWLSAGVSAPSSGIDGVAVGDVNNDGKVDLFLTADSDSGFLFLNQTPDGGSLSFHRNNLDIDINGNGEGASFADYDKDGDLDLYINVRNGSNQLWRNDLNDGGAADYLFVEPRCDLGGGVYRAAVGANVVLQDCDGNIISGIRAVPTTSGHGTDAPDQVHFGLPSGPDEAYNVIVKFVTVSGQRVEISRQITPSDLTHQTFIVYDTDADTYSRCSDPDQDEEANWDDLDDDNDGLADTQEMDCLTGTASLSDGASITSGSTVLFEAGEIDPVITLTPSTANDNVDQFSWETAEFGQTTSGSLGDGVLFHLSNSTSDPARASIQISLNQPVYNFSFDLGDLDEGAGEESATISAFNGSHEIPISDKNFSSFGSSVSLSGTHKLISNGAGGGANSGTHGSVRVWIPQKVDKILIEAEGDGVDWYVHLNHVTYCLGLDSDGDGLEDHLDLDKDQDGIPDLVESGGTDIDGNGLADDLTDSDDDGWADIYDNVSGSHTSGTPIVPIDSDRDGIADLLDLDSDNDGIPDVIEVGAVDTDGDGRIDGFADADIDGFHDDFDPTDDEPESFNDAAFTAAGNTPIITTATDSDSDGLANEGYNGGDQDEDERLNHLDLDADNDGLPDIIESGGLDADGDGRVDDALADGSLSADVDADGFSDTYDPDLNNDGDTSDAGDTGLPMIITSSDSDQDGKPETYPAFDNDQNGSTIAATTDADSDGYPNFLDLDADDDGIPDIVESGQIDIDANGKVDGISGAGTFTGSNDADGDGFYDALDPDDDRTTTDENESSDPVMKTVSSGSGDADGHPALPDVAGNTALMGGTNADFDGDGIPNYLDLDADNDGIADLVETFGSSVDSDTDGQVDNLSSNDGNQNGWHNTFEGDVPTTADASGSEYSNNSLPDYQTGTDKPDFDADGLPNYLDIDADNDGIVDLIEGQPSGTNLTDPFDGLQRYATTDANYNGWMAAFDPDESGTYIDPLNKESAEGPDYLDLDADNDGFGDLSEGHDANMDGAADRVPAGTDADGDGLDDSFDTDNSSFDPEGSNQSIQDENNDVGSGGDRDWRDLNSTTFPVEWLDFTALKQGTDVKLDWTTSRETNSDYFEVERSSDGRLFVQLGKVAAAGNSQSVRAYNFTDQGVEGKLTGTIAYRLRQVDIDGSFSYSSIVEVRLDASELDWEVYPNPVLHTLTIAAPSQWYQHQVKLELTQLNGQLVRSESFEGNQSAFDLDLSQLPAGLYMVKISNGEETLSRQIQKQ